MCRRAAERARTRRRRRVPPGWPRMAYKALEHGRVARRRRAAPVTEERGMRMPITYKIDVLARLKAAGYSTYRIRKDKILGEATVQLLREGKPVSWENIATMCRLLDCQPGDIMEYVPEGSGAGEDAPQA